MWYVIDCTSTPRLVVLATEDEAAADDVAVRFVALFGAVVVKAQGPAPSAAVVASRAAQVELGLPVLHASAAGAAQATVPVQVQPRYSADHGATWHDSEQAARERGATVQSWAQGRAHDYEPTEENVIPIAPCVCGQYRDHPVHLRP